MDEQQLTNAFMIGGAVLGYLLGSIPFGLVITKLAGLGDIRAIGSGNIGATNVLRTGRKDLALATLLLDAGKAGLAYWLAWGAATLYAGDAITDGYRHTIGLVCGAFAFVGHCYPVWL
jgi:glycerol-3-phosphate acyltransferase PlsY